jgi:hypothetical protein
MGEVAFVIARLEWDSDALLAGRRAATRSSFGALANAVIACSVSRASWTFTGVNSTPNEGATD